MQIEWEYTAESFFDQLSRPESAKVLHALDRLSTDPNGLAGNKIHKLAGSEDELWSLQVGADFIVLLRMQGDTITVVDVIPQRQIDGLRRAIAARQAVPG